MCLEVTSTHRMFDVYNSNCRICELFVAVTPIWFRLGPMELSEWVSEWQTGHRPCQPLAAGGNYIEKDIVQQWWRREWGKVSKTCMCHWVGKQFDSTIWYSNEWIVLSRLTPLKTAPSSIDSDSGNGNLCDNLLRHNCSNWIWRVR